MSTAACLLALWPALGQPAVPVEPAQAAIDRAADRFRAGDHAGALESLRTAETAAAATNDPALATIRFNIARCLQEMSRGQEAIAAYEAYLQLPDEPHRKERAWSAIQTLELQTFGGLQIACAPATARVHVPGLTKGPTSCPFTQRRVPPGTYTVEVSAISHLPERREITVATGAPTILDVSLAAAPGLNRGDSLVADSRGNSTASSPAPWLALGAGAAAAAGGVWLTFSAMEARDEAETLPPGSTRSETIDRYETREALSWACYGLAAAGIVAGSVLLLWSGEDDAARAGPVDPMPLAVRF